MYYGKFYYPGKTSFDYDRAQAKLDYIMEAWFALIITTCECLFFSLFRKSKKLQALFKIDPIGRSCIFVVEILLCLAVVSSAVCYAVDQSVPPFIDVKVLLLGLIASDTLELKHESSAVSSQRKFSSGGVVSSVASRLRKSLFRVSFHKAPRRSDAYNNPAGNQEVSSSIHSNAKFEPHPSE
ncbi:hypothetical protein HDU76_006562 [Blyttiomyces sp. JEL0837]|nr:hypothetical protein HDU76_006562 [Blyttiomyces sp. JEL0837]